MRSRAASTVVVAFALTLVAQLAVVGPAAAMPASSAASATPTAWPATSGSSASAAPASAASAPPAPFPAGITRLSGASRYETAVAVSKRYAPGVPVVYVASGADFPDALSAASAAALAGGPLLLTAPTSLPSAVMAELKRLRPAAIRVVGGTGAVSATVATALGRLAPTKRLAGADRYATGLAILKAAFTRSEHAIIATGRTFPDALAASGAAGAMRAPVVLVDGAVSTVPPATMAALAKLGVTSVAIAGGTGAVSDGIRRQLQKAGYAVKRYGGTTRYDTAALVNQAYFPAGSSSTTFLATGLDFPDALAAAALAGRLAAPLNVSPRDCVHPAVGDAIDSVGATSAVVLGGTAVVSNTAASNVRCVYPVTDQPLTSWALSPWTLNAKAAVPYSDRPPVNVADPSIKLDSTGLRIYLRRDTGARADHPVAYAQYGISALMEYKRTGKKVWLDRAVRHGQRLIDMHTVRDGGWWYPYSFPWTYYERTISAPWYSGMAQGQALSLFVRLAQQTGDKRWSTAADRTWTSFAQAKSGSAPSSSLVIDNHLYFEEYAGDQPPLLVLNGQIFAMFGLYDYWRYTGNPETARYFTGGGTTVLERMMPLVRVKGGVSYYCVQVTYCHSPLWQNQTYHVIHSWQLDTLARLTGDAAFTTWADRLRTDWTPTDASVRRVEPQNGSGDLGEAGETGEPTDPADPGATGEVGEPGDTGEVVPEPGLAPPPASGPRAGTGGDPDWIEP
ncbi:MULTISPECIES: cell wall-binding repeat-containing protein [unclassified Leifsonia]|uniref:cell wall-binding repeat-containing protein n=1 Tax=unclassified Leifsonia TaxID=2663824 RepID=UPI0007020E0E|nr:MULTISPECIES: cell wall-binding repeat-containing protein [unclassified Leifsonia]KQX05557.1 hypothetical protein ASC59_15785 [Leifsonia sp. Root1293]KRA09191.1 hypothetical protein ASD61_15780 [Leifsonia sp. Root60]